MGSRCEVVTWMETPRMRLSRAILLASSETRETSRTGLPIVGVYMCMYLCIHIRRCICMRVCGCGLSKHIWMSRVSRGGKRAQERYSEMDVVPRDWVCARTRENNLLVTSSVRHIFVTN